LPLSSWQGARNAKQHCSLIAAIKGLESINGCRRGGVPQERRAAGPARRP
jgi:hypothetical protein